MSFILHSLIQSHQTQQAPNAISTERNKHQTQQAPKRNKHQTYTMKASIVLFALVQGLALATPIQGGKAGEATDMNDPLIRDPHQPLPSKTAAGLPFTLREAKKWYDQHTLPDKCFEGKNKELCDRIYKFCLNILDPLYEDDIVTVSRDEKFRGCIITRLQHGMPKNYY